MIPLSAVYTLINFATFISGSVQQSGCPIGTYVNSVSEKNFAYCVDCPPGTFMPQKDHQHTTCFNCTEIEDPNIEILISPCKKDQNAEIQCVDDYYRIKATNPRSRPVCKECDPCPEIFHQVRRCQNYSNTFCCPDVNWDYVYDKYGNLLCRERPWMCRKGQFMDTSFNDCKPCPDGTFMSVDYHSYTECWDCQYHSDADLPLHTEIIQQCNSTHPAIYSCKEGYYINHSLSYRGDDIGCLPCKSCSDEMFVGRQCDKFQDTICCHRLGMQIVDGFDQAGCLKDEDKVTPTFDKPLSEGTVSIAEDAFDGDDDCEHFMGLLVASFVINIGLLLIIICVVWLQRNYLSSKANKLVSRFKAYRIEHLTTSHHGKPASCRISIEEPKETVLQNDGSGKSTTGNAILGKKMFICDDSMSSVTKSIEFGDSEFGGTAVKVVDVPDLGEGSEEINNVTEHLKYLIRKNSQDIVVITMVIKYGGRFTKNDTNNLEILRSKLGKDYIPRCLTVVMTHGDIFEKNKKEKTQTFQDWCAEQKGPFADLIKESGKRIILFDNTEEKKREQYIQDLEKNLKIITADRSSTSKINQPTQEFETWSQKTVKACITSERIADNPSAIVETSPVGRLREKRKEDTRVEKLPSRMGKTAENDHRQLQRGNPTFIGQQRCYKTM